jgi:hypothetical protein
MNCSGLRPPLIEGLSRKMFRSIPILFLFLLCSLCFAGSEIIDLTDCKISIPSDYVSNQVGGGVIEIIYSRKLGSLRIGSGDFENKRQLQVQSTQTKSRVSITSYSDMAPREPYKLVVIQTSEKYVSIQDRPMSSKLSTLVTESCLSSLTI